MSVCCVGLSLLLLSVMSVFPRCLWLPFLFSLPPLSIITVVCCPHLPSGRLNPPSFLPAPDFLALPLMSCSSWWIVASGLTSFSVCWFGFVCLFGLPADTNLQNKNAKMFQFICVAFDTWVQFWLLQRSVNAATKTTIKVQHETSYNCIELVFSSMYAGGTLQFSHCRIINKFKFNLTMF